MARNGSEPASGVPAARPAALRLPAPARLQRACSPSSPRGDRQRLRPAEDTTRSCVVPLLLDDVGMTVEGDVGPISVERAKDAGALVSDFTIEEARWIEPASRLGIGCEFHLLVRGEVDRGISVNIVVGAAAETEA